ncbi:MAG TPA: winged helix-turn-helix domain-containing protein [Steroidobacteraceae bacterium]|nr:winged helix-turn-helix domain-containing protein [Steroidobacteraceae bacterium]
MEYAKQTRDRLRFGSFEVDLRLGALSRQGARLPLQDLPFRALVMLLQRPGELVTREELRQQLWPQTVIDFDHGLNKAINKIRDVMGDSATHPRFIETVARRGYRFLADVTPVEPPAASESSSVAAPAAALAPDVAAVPRLSPETTTQPAPSAATSRRWRVYAAVSCALLLVVAALGWHQVMTRLRDVPVHSLAVLPLENLSGDSAQDYFADGMTDELITQLAQIGALRVISRASVMAYKGQHKSLSAIARELDVQAVVEGSVVSAGQRMRITAQLIRVPQDEHIWAHSYEGDLRDTLKLQGEVARTIADQVRVTLTPHEKQALAASREVAPNAYQAYLKGRYFWNKRTGADLKTAIAYFKAAAVDDPDYAEAYVGLADSYALAGDWEYGVMSPEDAWPQATAAAKRALALDDGLGAAHASMALAQDLYGWDWDAAGAEFQRAIALSPNYASAHHWYAFHLLLIGRDSQAIAELREAEHLDPLSLIISADIADALCIAHLYDQSIVQSRQTLDLEPNFALAHYELGQALEQKHQYPQATQEFLRAIELGGHSAVFDSNLAHLYSQSGRKSDALRILNDLQTQHASHPTAYAGIALIYVGLGDNSAAIDWLEKAYDARFNPSILLRPAFDPLRSDPRFQSLLSRMGLDAGRK